MKIRWWKSRGHDIELEEARERVEKMRKVIDEQRETVRETVRDQKETLAVNHLAERVRWALRDNLR